MTYMQWIGQLQCWQDTTYSKGVLQYLSGTHMVQPQCNTKHNVTQQCVKILPVVNGTLKENCMNIHKDNGDKVKLSPSNKELYHREIKLGQDDMWLFITTVS